MRAKCISDQTLDVTSRDLNTVVPVDFSDPDNPQDQRGVFFTQLHLCLIHIVVRFCCNKLGLSLFRDSWNEKLMLVYCV